MNQNLINQYQVNFVNEVYHNPISNLNYITKIPNVENDYLFQFLFNWSAEEIDEYLLPFLNQVINGSLSEYDTGSETIIVLIKPNLTYFLIDNVGTNYPTIPTQDFKEICIGWRDFLLTPPLNGTIVP